MRGKQALQQADIDPKHRHPFYKHYPALPSFFSTQDDTTSWWSATGHAWIHFIIGRNRKPHRGSAPGKGKGRNRRKMGNEESSLVDDSVPPDTLKSRDVKGLAEYIKSGKARRIVLMSGAGISTSAGIPDFRSPDTGLYANLARLNLPFAEAVFDINFFRKNPLPFYTLANELYPGKYRPTITHSFIKLLHDKGLLLKHFTQNIDCLDREAGVPGDKIVEAHGSFATQKCIDCGAKYPDDKMQEHVRDKNVPHCLAKNCNGLVKPEIVFFGEALPSAFFASHDLPRDADLVIVLGTSLTVQPFASLPGVTRDGVPRVLINLERVGSLGSRPDDVLLLGDCDAGVCKLANACGWLEELVKLWESVGGKPNAQHPAREAKTKDEALSDEVDKLTKEVDESLKISSRHEEQSRKLAQKQEGKPESAAGAVAATPAAPEDLPSESSKGTPSNKKPSL